MPQAAGVAEPPAAEAEVSLSPEEVRHVAHLARLSLAETEVSSYARQLSGILDYFQRLSEVRTDGVSPTTHPLTLNNVLRDDNSRPGCGVEAALRNAPDFDQGFFKVPKVLGGGEG
jgi:aspartyl-tRNA(Asn)/glutamyl-tRNA(Gln) amidotransferase subunit C